MVWFTSLLEGEYLPRSIMCPKLFYNHVHFNIIFNSAGIKDVLSSSIRNEIAQQQGRTYQHTEAMEYEIELKGQSNRKYALIWTDVWRQGIVELYPSGGELPFRFRERTELEVIEA